MRNFVGEVEFIKIYAKYIFPSISLLLATHVPIVLALPQVHVKHKFLNNYPPLVITEPMAEPSKFNANI